MSVHRSLFNLTIGLILSIVLFSCGEYKKPSRGQYFEVMVVMDSSKIDSPYGKAIQDVFEQSITTIPAPERMYDLKFYQVNNQAQLDVAKRAKNVIFAAPITDDSNEGRFLRAIISDEVEERIQADQTFAIPLEDQWYKDQWVMLLSGSTDSAMAANIYKSGDALVQNLTDKELKRWKETVFSKKRQTKIEDSLMTKYGWKIGIQHDYNKHIDTLGFVSLRRFLPDHDRWIWVYWRDNVKNISFLDDEWINARRDSIMKRRLRGTRDSSYITTEYRRDIKTRSFELNGNYVVQTNGTWRMVNDFMGGLFVNYAIYDQDQERLYLVEMGNFAPRFNKRRFLRQFESMIFTFETDSTFSEYPEEVQG